MHASILATPEAIRKICIEAEFLFMKWKLPDRTASDLVLSLDEALTNIAEHGFTPATLPTSRIIVEIVRKSDRINIVIRDNARAFNIDQISDINRTDYLKSGRIGGFGVVIIKKLMDNVKSIQMDSHNILWMTKFLRRKPQLIPDYISTPTADARVEDGILIVRTHPGAYIELEDARDQLEKYFKMIEVYPDKTAHAMLIDARGMTMISRKAREYYTDYPDSGIVAIALIIDSVFTTWLANLFISLNRSREQQIRMFTRETEARVWLRNFSAESDKRQAHALQGGTRRAGSKFLTF